MPSPLDNPAGSDLVRLGPGSAVARSGFVDLNILGAVVDWSDRISGSTYTTQEGKSAAEQRLFGSGKVRQFVVGNAEARLPEGASRYRPQAMYEGWGGKPEGEGAHHKFLIASKGKREIAVRLSANLSDGGYVNQVNTYQITEDPDKVEFAKNVIRYSAGDAATRAKIAPKLKNAKGFIVVGADFEGGDAKVAAWIRAHAGEDMYIVSPNLSNGAIIDAIDDAGKKSKRGQIRVGVNAHGAHNDLEDPKYWKEQVHVPEFLANFAAGLAKRLPYGIKAGWTPKEHGVQAGLRELQNRANSGIEITQLEGATGFQPTALGYAHANVIVAGKKRLGDAAIEGSARFNDDFMSGGKYFDVLAVGPAHGIAAKVKGLFSRPGAKRLPNPNQRPNGTWFSEYDVGTHRRPMGLSEYMPLKGSSQRNAYMIDPRGLQSTVGAMYELQSRLDGLARQGVPGATTAARNQAQLIHEFRWRPDGSPTPGESMVLYSMLTGSTNYPQAVIDYDVAAKSTSFGQSRWWPGQWPRNAGDALGLDLYPAFGPQLGNRGVIDSTLLRLVRTADMALARRGIANTGSLELNNEGFYGGVLESGYEVGNALTATAVNFGLFALPALKLSVAARHGIMKAVDYGERSQGFTKWAAQNTRSAIGVKDMVFTQVTRQMLTEFAQPVAKIFGGSGHNELNELVESLIKRFSVYDDKGNLIEESLPERSVKALNNDGMPYLRLNPLTRIVSDEGFGKLGSVVGNDEVFRGIVHGAASPVQVARDLWARDFSFGHTGHSATAVKTGWGVFRDQMFGWTAAKGQGLGVRARTGLFGAMAVGIAGAWAANQFTGYLGTLAPQSVAQQFLKNWAINGHAGDGRRWLQEEYQVGGFGNLARWGRSWGGAVGAGLGLGADLALLPVQAGVAAGLRAVQAVNRWMNPEVDYTVAGPAGFQRLMSMHLAGGLAAEGKTTLAQMLMNQVEQTPGPSSQAYDGKNISSLAFQFSRLSWLFAVTLSSTNLSNRSYYSVTLQGPVWFQVGASAVMPFAGVQTFDPETQSVQQSLQYNQNNFIQNGLSTGIALSMAMGANHLASKFGFSRLAAGTGLSPWLHAATSLNNHIFSLPFRLAQGIGRIGLQNGLAVALSKGADVGFSEAFRAMSSDFGFERVQAVDALGGNSSITRSVVRALTSVQGLTSAAVTGAHVDAVSGGHLGRDQAFRSSAAGRVYAAGRYAGIGLGLVGAGLLLGPIVASVWSGGSDKWQQWANEQLVAARGWSLPARFTAQFVGSMLGFKAATHPALMQPAADDARPKAYQERNDPDGGTFTGTASAIFASSLRGFKQIYAGASSFLTIGSSGFYGLNADPMTEESWVWDHKVQDERDVSRGYLQLQAFGVPIDISTSAGHVGNKRNDDLAQFANRANLLTGTQNQAHAFRRVPLHRQKKSGVITAMFHEQSGISELGTSSQMMLANRRAQTTWILANKDTPASIVNAMFGPRLTPNALARMLPSGYGGFFHTQGFNFGAKGSKSLSHQYAAAAAAADGTGYTPEADFEYEPGDHPEGWVDRPKGTSRYETFDKWQMTAAGVGLLGLTATAFASTFVFNKVKGVGKITVGGMGRDLIHATMAAMAEKPSHFYMNTWGVDPTGSGSFVVAHSSTLQGNGVTKAHNHAHRFWLTSIGDKYYTYGDVTFESYNKLYGAHYGQDRGLATSMRQFDQFTPRASIEQNLFRNLTQLHFEGDLDYANIKRLGDNANLVGYMQSHTAKHSVLGSMFYREHQTKMLIHNLERTRVDTATRLTALQAEIAATVNTASETRLGILRSHETANTKRIAALDARGAGSIHAITSQMAKQAEGLAFMRQELAKAAAAASVTSVNARGAFAALDANPNDLRAAATHLESLGLDVDPARATSSREIIQHLAEMNQRSTVELDNLGFKGKMGYVAADDAFYKSLWLQGGTKGLLINSWHGALGAAHYFMSDSPLRQAWHTYQSKVVRSESERILKASLRSAGGSATVPQATMMAAFENALSLAEHEAVHGPSPAGLFNSMKDTFEEMRKSGAYDFLDEDTWKKFNELLKPELQDRIASEAGSLRGHTIQLARAVTPSIGGILKFTTSGAMDTAMLHGFAKAHSGAYGLGVAANSEEQRWVRYEGLTHWQQSMAPLGLYTATNVVGTPLLTAIGAGEKAAAAGVASRTAVAASAGRTLVGSAMAGTLPGLAAGAVVGGVLKATGAPNSLAISSGAWVGGLAANAYALYAFTPAGAGAVTALASAAGVTALSPALATVAGIGLGIGLMYGVSQLAIWGAERSGWFKGLDSWMAADNDKVLDYYDKHPWAAAAPKAVSMAYDWGQRLVDNTLANMNESWGKSSWGAVRGLNTVAQTFYTMLGGNLFKGTAGGRLYDPGNFSSNDASANPQLWNHPFNEGNASFAAQMTPFWYGGAMGAAKYNAANQEGMIRRADNQNALNSWFNEDGPGSKPDSVIHDSQILQRGIHSTMSRSFSSLSTLGPSSQMMMEQRGLESLSAISQIGRLRSPYSRNDGLPVEVRRNGNYLDQMQGLLTNYGMVTGRILTPGIQTFGGNTSSGAAMGAGGTGRGGGLHELIPGLSGTPTKASAYTRSVINDKHLVRGFSQALNAALATAESQGISISANNAYRSREAQQVLWDRSDKSGRWVGRPGHSRHQHGDAIDFEGFGNFAKTSAYRFLKQEGHKFGLYQPMSWEPWHWEYDARLAGVRAKPKPAAAHVRAGFEPWRNLVTEAAKAHGLPAKLIQSIMYQESRYGHYDNKGGIKTSPVGALGLMQVMPDMGAHETLSGKPYKNYGFTKQQLADPKANILAGIAVLKAKIKATGSLEEGVRAYNGSGPDALRYQREVLDRWHALEANETVQAAPAPRVMPTATPSAVIRHAQPTPRPSVSTQPTLAPTASPSPFHTATPSPFHTPSASSTPAPTSTPFHTPRPTATPAAHTYLRAPEKFWNSPYKEEKHDLVESVAKTKKPALKPAMNAPVSKGPKAPTKVDVSVMLHGHEEHAPKSIDPYQGKRLPMNEVSLQQQGNQLMAQATYPDGSPWMSLFDNYMEPIETALIDPYA